MDVDDLRIPLLPDTGEHSGLDHVQHVPVSVVVVADVLLIEPRHRRDLVRGAHVGQVPVGDHGLAVGIQRGPKQRDDVVADRRDTGVLAVHELVGEPDYVLCPGDLARVQAPADVDDRLAVAGQITGRVIREACRVSECVRDASVSLHGGEVLGGGDEGHPPIASFRGAPHHHHRDAVRSFGEAPEIVHRLLVRGQPEVVAGLEAEYRLGRRNLPLGGLRKTRDPQTKRARQRQESRAHT
jgi:hypothetical protein